MVISSEEICLQEGLREQPIYMLEENKIEKKEIVGVLVMLIEDLQEYMGKGTMKAKQMFDVAEYIYEQYPNLSIKSVANCFKMIKKSEPPYNEPIYGGINGRFIMESLRKYHEIVDEYLFGDAERKVEIEMQYKKNNNISETESKLYGIAGRLEELKQNVKQLQLTEAIKKYENEK